MTMERNVEIKTHQSPFPQKGEGKSFKCKIWLQFQSSAIQNNRVANKPQKRNHLFPQYLIPLFPSQKPAFTLAEGATHVDMYGNTRRCAFTMAEVLITLGIIGIVAAMTLPALIGNYQKKVLATKLKKTYTILSQQFIRTQLDNGDFDTWPKEGNIDIEEYFNIYYKPYFNGVNMCKYAKDCGYSSEFPWRNIDDSKINWGLQSNNSRILFQLNDGTTVFLPRNTTDGAGNPIYVNYFYVDINGAKTPNIVGHDVFTFMAVNKKGIMPQCYNRSYDYINANCSKTSTGNTNCCAAKIMADGWEIKDDYPW